MRSESVSIWPSSPTPEPPGGDQALEGLLDFLEGRSAIVLSGAGCSTESGIPDYRGPQGRLRKKGPMRYQEFVGSEEARARYWSRSMVGWPRFSRVRPNEGHRALARLEALGVVRGVITQNVDGLHQAAGSSSVLELHGSLARVRCLECGSTESREDLQERLTSSNPGFATTAERYVADGDAELPESSAEGFWIAPCLICGGVLKPDVVFFGENVPRERLARTWRLYEDGDVLLVVGSSLTVFSGRRFVMRAADEGRPVGIVNLGPTRGDDLAHIKVEEKLGALLPRLADAMSKVRHIRSG